MSRPYTMKRRADQQSETRRRIVEAAVELHSSVGPARTNTSMVAERAGVQRHTLYAHFPDERSLLLACSGLVAERDPLPDAEPWRSIADRRERLRVGLQALYGWYGRNADLAGCVLRDVEHHALTREIAELRIMPYMRAYNESLGTDLSPGQRAMLGLMLSYFTWRTLVRESGLDRDATVTMAVHAIDGAG
ncbi:TetR/AcrR family transcriptional regulator [Azospirillum sp. TSO22-1]|uniref:TetR/AcrR family transcriptional regulator n=1 Tax=Azospirillum sp. TSO22-1 TaxID=716789 RepID=UPI000D61303E|nr:TetR/AcrR family transcriptional regulator [Azospirillum sp. TSO22-1]PWC31682.1 TetR family transcriptional regulator [Azospirillum sp. TSO22-1]